MTPRTSPAPVGTTWGSYQLYRVAGLLELSELHAVHFGWREKVCLNFLDFGLFPPIPTVGSVQASDDLKRPFLHC